MTFNPYTPPGAAPEQVPGALQPTGGPMDWEPTEAAGRAWEIVKAHFWPLVGAFVVVGVIQNVIQNALGQILGAVDPTALQRVKNMDDVIRIYQDAAVKGGVVAIIMIPIQAFFAVGLKKISLSVARGGAPNFADIFTGGSRILPMVGAMFLKGIAITIGFLFLIVPGIWLALALSQVEYFVVDRNMGPIEAFKASMSATEGQKGKIFLYGLVSIGIGLLGLLACCIGILVAMPVIEVGSAIIFTRLTGTAVSPDMFGGYGKGPPMGPYGGPPGYGPPGGGFGGPPPGGFGGPPPGGGYGPPGGGFGGPPPGGGYGPPPGGGYGPPPGGGYGPPGGGYGPPGGGYGPR